MEHGASAYPWSVSALAKAKAAATARTEALKAAQVDLNFLKGEKAVLRRPDGSVVSFDEAIGSLKEEAVVGLYFSAHWCGPCRGFTPQLAECYKALQAAGRPFEIVFVSSDRDEAAFKEYHNSMPWLALPYQERALKADLSALFSVQGIPTLVLLSKNGTIITEEGRAAVGYGAEYFPWDTDALERGAAEAKDKARKVKESAKKAEEETVSSQQAAAVPVLRRMRGSIGSVEVEASGQAWAEGASIKFDVFSTVGAPEALTTEGVCYYEVTVEGTDGIAQLGFALRTFNGDGEDTYSGDGAGDDSDSWAVDGARQLLWHNGTTDGWQCTWAKGDVVGFAANVTTGQLAVSKNGSWAESACGVVYTDEAIKGGVFPLLTAGSYQVQVRLDKASWKYAPPPPEVYAPFPVEA